MQTIDVCKRDSGKIWFRKPQPSSDGVLVTVTNTVSSALQLHTRNVRFLHAAFDVQGDSFIAADYQGHVYLFDLHRNKFSLVQRMGAACTALAFQLRRRSEFLAGLSDYSLKCYDTDAREVVASMRGHESVVQSISVHSSGRYALTCSPDSAHLWDLDTFQRRRKLNIKQNVGITKVFFLPLSNTILTCFKDDTIFAWETDTLACKYQLHVPEGREPGFKAFAASRDGRQLVGGGRSRYLHVWSLDTHQLLQIVELPKKVTSVKQLEFLPDSFNVAANQVLGVLSQDGIMRYINLSTCKQLFDVGSLEDRVSSMIVGGDGRHIVAVMDSGDIRVYSVQALCAELNKPPPPLMKVLKGNKMADATVDSEATDSKKSSKPRSSLKTTTKPHPVLPDPDSTVSDYPDGLDMDKLYSILKGYGEYPAKYRMFIWRCLLRLPENHAAYGALVDKGTHPAYLNLHHKYPIKSQKLLRVLQRVLSALAHWSPIFGETDYLPTLAFPFIKLFQNNQLLAFEVIASILSNWCSHWFEYFPNPPVNQLGLIENTLAYHDKELLAHFIKHGVTSQVYAWPLLQTLFSEVLTRDEWLSLFDNVFTRPPCFLLLLLVSYCITNRGPLLKCSELDDFKFFFRHRNAVDVGAVVREAYRLDETTPPDIHPASHCPAFTPLTRGQYPIFNKYPKFIVDYQIQERERIRQSEEEYLRQKQVALELQQESRQRSAEEEAWYRQQQLLLEAEERRRRLISEEEQRLTDQRTRLAAMNRELKMKELQLMDATRRKFLHFTQLQKEAEITRLDDDLRRKAELREKETQAAVDEAEVRNMELQLQKNMLEQDMYREFSGQSQKTRNDLEFNRRRRAVESRVSEERAGAVTSHNLTHSRQLQESLSRGDQHEVLLSLQNQLHTRQKLDELHNTHKQIQLDQLQEENRRLQRTVEALMSDRDTRRADPAPPASPHRQDRPSTTTDAAPTGTHHREPDQTERSTLRDSAQIDPAPISYAHLDPAPISSAHRDPAPISSAHRDPAHLDSAHHDSAHHDSTLYSTAPLDSPSYSQYLNDTPSEASSTHFSLDRGRSEFNEREQELMAGVRRLRQRLAQESRNKRPPPLPN